MHRRKRQNLELVGEAASALGELAEEVVFVGGAATALFITDRAAPDVRQTMDVDVILEAVTRHEYYRFADRLRAKGFVEAPEEGVICRWKRGGLLLDVMPTDPAILGFSNQWYTPAVREARQAQTGGCTLWVVSPPYQLATKFEAFHGRGGGDWLASHDIEDIVAVLDGCMELLEEIEQAPEDVKRYLAEQARLLLEADQTDYVIAGHLDRASQGRAAIIRERLGRIARL